jgi:DNA-directed RNA polymerase specialized sigma24 family protein
MGRRMPAAHSDDTTGGPAHLSTRPRELTPERFDHLLDALSSNRDEAAERYVAARSRLVQFFRWERCDDAETLADDVVDRVARRLSEGEQIANLGGYFLGVARLVRLEARQRQARDGRLAPDIAEALQPDGPSDDHESLACLERCLARLPDARRGELLAYYTGDAGGRIAARRGLAAALGIGPVALRNRMLRLRQRLERCVNQCLTVPARRDGSGDRRTSREHPSHSGSMGEDV